MEAAPGEKFESLSYRELQKAAKSQGLKAGGKRQALLYRLKQVRMDSLDRLTYLGLTIAGVLFALYESKEGHEGGDSQCNRQPGKCAGHPDAIGGYSSGLD